MFILIKRNQFYLSLIFFTVLFILFHTLAISATIANNQEKGIISPHLDWMQSLNKDIPVLAIEIIRYGLLIYFNRATYWLFIFAVFRMIRETNVILIKLWRL